MSTANSVALVTGGTGSLGRAVVKAFLEEQAAVISTYRRQSEWQEAQTEWPDVGDRLIGESVDVLEASAVEEMVHRAVDRFGRLDVLVNLVGGYAAGRAIAGHPLDDWEKMLQLNLHSCFLCCRAALPIMIDQKFGRIVNISSKGAVEPSAGTGGYAVSKAAVIALSKVIAVEGAEHGVTCNVLLPSIIDTPANRQAMPKADFSKWVSPDSLAQVIVFLASKESADINGAAIPVYGRS